LQRKPYALELLGPEIIILECDTYAKKFVRDIHYTSKGTKKKEKEKTLKIYISLTA
jgi:hypothetical protein